MRLEKAISLLLGMATEICSGTLPIGPRGPGGRLRWLSDSGFRYETSTACCTSASSVSAMKYRVLMERIWADGCIVKLASMGE